MSLGQIDSQEPIHGATKRDLVPPEQPWHEPRNRLMRDIMALRDRAHRLVALFPPFDLVAAQTLRESRLAAIIDAAPWRTRGVAPARVDAGALHFGYTAT